MRPTLILLGLLVLAACGADGEPYVPSAPVAENGLAISGQVTVGVNLQ